MTSIACRFTFALAAALVWLGSPPVAAQGFEIGPDLSGTFYDPAQSGQGFIVEHLDAGGSPALVVSWFAYHQGEPIWLVGVGPVVGDAATVPLSIGSGGQFPPAFQSNQASLQDWGTLTLRFVSARSGTATWSTTQPGFSNGSMSLTRLTELSLGGEKGTEGIGGCHSGSWYDPTQSGHGVFVELIGPPTQRIMVAIWYVYVDGKQTWMTALGPVNGSTAELQAQITRGANFPPAFQSGDVISEDWGTMRFTALGADSARWEWSSTQPGFGSGTLDLQRLTSHSGYDCGPRDDKAAARFLTQASFGPDDDSVQRVQDLGLAAWIAQQQAQPVSPQKSVIEQQIAAQVLLDPRNAQFYRPYRVERWFSTAVNGADQLRQRMAYALSQILVLSDVGGLANNPIGVADYHDVLANHAFGNYRDLLKAVTYHPAMAVFLSHLRNQKTDWTLGDDGELVPGLISPDENYAREVMQLFSIGLIERNLDFSPLMVGGATVPTYTQDLVTQTAKVLTGLAYPCTGPAVVQGITINRNCGLSSGIARQFSTSVFASTPGRYAVPGNVTALAHPDTYGPLVCYPRYADTGRSATSANGYAVLPAPNDTKTLLAGVEIGPSAVACHSGTPSGEQQACIDYCDDQIDTLVETLFQHPNVAPFIARQLIQRFVTSNPSPTYIERVARVFVNDGSGVRGNLGATLTAVLLDPEARSALPGSRFGKLREPLLKLTALWRAFEAPAGTNGAYGIFTPERFLAQRPLGANSVFNFYEPDYAHPGEIAAAGMVAPEFQILDESTTVTTSDAFWILTFTGYTSTDDRTVTFRAPATNAYLPPTELDELPASSGDLVEALNLKLLAGAMPESLRARLVAFADGPLAQAEHRLRALNLIHLILISPSFAAQP